MSQSDSDNSGTKGAGFANKTGADSHQDPDWTRGLKRLYDSVLNEPMPDAFKDLLAQFDSDHPGK